MTFHLQIAPKDGILRVTSPSIATCVFWLRDYLGLEIDGQGWSKPGWRGTMAQFGDSWHAAAWREDKR